MMAGGLVTLARALAARWRGTGLARRFALARSLLLSYHLMLTLIVHALVQPPWRSAGRT